MKMLVVCSPKFEDYQLLSQKLDRLTIRTEHLEVMTRRTAEGALARRWCFDNRVKYTVWQDDEEDKMWENVGSLVTFGEGKEINKTIERAEEEDVEKIVTYNGEPNDKQSCR